MNISVCISYLSRSYMNMCFVFVLCVEQNLELDFICLYMFCALVPVLISNYYSSAPVVTCGRVVVV